MAPETSHEPIILPGLSALNREYWTGGAENRLLIAQCVDCNFYLHPPMPACRECGCQDVKPQPVSGLGKVASFTINRQAWLPGITVPFVFAAVELAEQAELYIFSNIESCPVDTVTQGMAVKASFRQVEDIYLPLFTPVTS